MRKLIIGCLICVAVACTGDKIPKTVLPIKDMSLIMWDMMKMDEYFIRLTTKDSLNKLAKENIRMYEQVFKSYGIDRKTFYNSYAYYESHPAHYKALIDTIDALSNRQREFLLKQTPAK